MCRQEPGSKAAAHCQVKVSTKGNWQFSGCRLFWGVLVTARPPRALSTEGKRRPREWWASRSPLCEQTTTPKPVSQTPLTRICREASAGSGAHSLAAGRTRLRCPHTGCRAPSHSLPQVGELSMPGFSMRPPPLRTQCGCLGDLFWDLLPTGPRPPCLQPNCPARSTDHSFLLTHQGTAPVVQWIPAPQWPCPALCRILSPAICLILSQALWICCSLAQKLWPWSFHVTLPDQLF